MKTYADIARRARELNDLRAQPTRQWTLPLVCDHLAKAMVGSTGILGSGSPEKPSPLVRRVAGRILVLGFGYIPNGVPSPPRVLPEKDITWEQAIESLEKAVAVCEEKSRTVQTWLEHPMIGFSDARTWQRFHVVHAKHHFGCLKTFAR